MPGSVQPGDGAAVGEHSFDCHDCQPAKVNIPEIYPRLPFLRGFCKSPLIWDGAKSPEKASNFYKDKGPTLTDNAKFRQKVTYIVPLPG